MKKILLLYLIGLFLSSSFFLGNFSKAKEEASPTSNITFETQAAASGNKDIKFSWTSVDKASTYAIKRNSEKIETVAQTTYTDKNVTEGSYTYEIIALDSTAKVIATSTIKLDKTATGINVNSTTNPIPDPSAPKVSDITFPDTKIEITSIKDLIVTIINWLLGLGGVLAVIAIVYSGIMYITAGGDQTKAENAKKNLIWAITGIVLILLALVIINEIAGILGG